MSTLTPTDPVARLTAYFDSRSIGVETMKTYIVTQTVTDTFEVAATTPELAAKVARNHGYRLSRAVIVDRVSEYEDGPEVRAGRWCAWCGLEIPAPFGSIYCSSRCDTDQFTYVSEDD